MKNFDLFKYCVLFFGIIAILDLSCGFYCDNIFPKISYGIYGSINRSLNSDEEMLILGSSRAMHHYNPEIFSDSLNMSCYNSGLGGYGIFLNYAILEERIKRKPPKLVILDLSPNVIVDDRSYTKLNVLLPYFYEYSTLKEIIILDPNFSRLELIFNLYRYNSTLYEFVRNSLKPESRNNNGFLPLKGELNESNFSPFYLQNETMDENKLAYLIRIIELCKSNDVMLITVVSPTYLKYDRENRIIQELKVLFEDRELEFMDFSDYPSLYQNPKYFADQIHMNNLGSNLFTSELAHIVHLMLQNSVQ